MAATSTKADFDDPPPPYLEKTTSHKKLNQEVDLVHRLQCFITRLLVPRYDIQSEIREVDDDDTTYHDHYLDLCKEYCILLSMQFDTRLEVLATKQELLRVIFEPARILGIPADVMEWFSFFTRRMPNKLPHKHEFDVARISSYPLGMLLCLVVDYTIMIDAAVESRFPGLVPRLKDRCLVLHQLQYPWMLDVRSINLDQIVKTLHDYRHLGCPVKSHNHHSSSSSSAHGIRGKDTYVSAPMCSQFPHLQISCYQFSSNFPSFLLPYRLHTSWPLVSLLLVQSRHPCVALASPSTFQKPYISHSDLTLWTQKARKDCKPTFQPRCKKTAPETFSCGLPNTIKVANLRFGNPEGGISRSAMGEEGEEWEVKYVRDHSAVSSCHGEMRGKGTVGGNPIEQQSFNKTHDQYSRLRATFLVGIDARFGTAQAQSPRSITFQSLVAISNRILGITCMVLKFISMEPHFQGINIREHFLRW